jgi:ribosomal RNA-processing protein 7
MTVFNEQEAENARALARRRQEPDEDGFITVVRGGRVAPARQEEAAALAKKKEEKETPKNFYRFQTREVRKEKHQQLLAKFEMDKKKVAERKNMRKFKVSELSSWFGI